MEQIHRFGSEVLPALQAHQVTRDAGLAMRVLTTLPQDDLNDVPAAARAAEAAGYDGLVTMENRNEPFLALGVAAVNTTRVGLAPGIAIAFSRSPMAVANASWDLQVASRGRFVLGLGSQVRAHNENRFSVKWSAAGAAAARVRRGAARDLAVLGEGREARATGASTTGSR